ncbi:MAG TPA: hypothetical protein VMF32_05215, partial [Xanthobacteraceae bacterium]|nr:hypothetical protein [Xanthobacteraceae bacterium]
MTLRWRQIAFLAAALGALASLVVPLSSEATDGLFAQPLLLTGTLSTAALYAGAAFVSPWVSIALTFAGVVLGCAVTLGLLHDPAIAGYAASGFWLFVLANWGAAWLGVAGLASQKPHDKVASRIVDLAIPLLFGAFVFYLWEVAVRGFGVPTVLLPPPSMIAVRFFSSLWMLWQDF